MAAQWYQQEPSRSLSQPQPASWAYPCELGLFSYLVSRVTSFFLPVSQNVSRGAEVVGVGFLDCLHDNESTESTDRRLQTASPLTPHLSSPPSPPPSSTCFVHIHDTAWVCFTIRGIRPSHKCIFLSRLGSRGFQQVPQGPECSAFEDALPFRASLPRGCCRPRPETSLEAQSWPVSAATRREGHLPWSELHQSAGFFQEASWL